MKLQEEREEGREEGRQIGRLEGQIMERIKTSLIFNATKETIVGGLIRDFHISEDEAEKYYETYK